MRPYHACALLLAVLLAGCSHDDSSTVSDGGGSTPETPTDLVMKAENALPPGQSGFFSVAGQAAGLLTGNPGDYGAHVDDQRELYWSFKSKPGVLGTKPGTPESPLSGVQIYRDSYGVPIIYAPNVHDLWFGVGYAIAQDRLFLMDAVRRMGAGTFSELTGCGGVPADIQQRVVTYTDDEYQTIFDALSQDAKDSVTGYVDGANAWRASLLTHPLQLPAEYALLTTFPAEFTIKDVLAAGVYITRFVASEGGNEFLNIRMLKQLQSRYGSAQAGKDAFEDLTWLNDDKAAVTIPRSVATFSNQPTPPQGREAVFSGMADWAVNLPETIWKGPGTGNAPAPLPCSLPTSPGSLPGIGLGAGEVLRSPRKPLTLQQARRLSKQDKAQAGREAVRSAIRALYELRAHLHGGSMAYAIGPSRTRDHGALMVSGPQLGYTYPTLLVEYEIHSGDYNARGSSVPILPVVGIGYSDYAAWGLTTGYSKTIDSFIETICSTAQIAAGTCKADQYFHMSQWKDMSCRDETFKYRAAEQGIPVGPAILTQKARICRTVHGPIVARDDAAGLARSLQYAMWLHEIDTIEGARGWNKAKTFDEFRQATSKVSWNENVTVATRDGHIAFFHPGLFPSRSGLTDMRLPSPGTGEYDFGGNLPFEQTPHAIDPPQGYLANWNTKPAYGWLDGEGMGSTSRPGGPGQRVTSIQDFIAGRSNWTFADLATIDQHHGTFDHRAREYIPVIAAFRQSAASSLSDAQKAALDLMLSWDGVAFGPGIDLADEGATDGPAATIFGEYVIALRDELFGDLRNDVLDPGQPDPDPNNPNPEAGLTIYGRVAGVGSHVFDQSVMDNVVMRVLNPAGSALVLRRDYAGGRSRDAVMLAALDTLMTRLASTYNGGAALAAADLAKCKRVHPRSQICSLSGVIGPGSDTIPGTHCVTMPYEDRGSWVHHVGFEKP